MSETKSELADCLCGNPYLAIRNDIYKDKRPFVYCDCCGALTTLPLWGIWVKPRPACLGQMLIAYRKCGRVARTAWIPGPDEDREAYLAFVLSIVENPNIVRVERVDRYTGDPAPEPECENCKDTSCNK